MGSDQSPSLHQTPLQSQCKNSPLLVDRLIKDRMKCETIPERCQTSRPFPKHQKQRLLDTDGLVKGGGLRKGGETKPLGRNTQIQLCFCSNHLTSVKELFTSNNGVAGLSFLNV